jgi:hypothetical protein
MIQPTVGVLKLDVSTFHLRTLSTNTHFNQVLKNGSPVVKFPQSSASGKQQAKDIAANTAWQSLCSQFPHLDLINV